LSGETQINYFYLILALLGALAAHVSVNALNEYDDFKSGLDLKTQPTPFSGGSGTLPKHPKKANIALISGIISLLITIIIGVYFLYVRGIGIFPLGGLGIILIITYTKWITRSPFICLIAPGIAFGPLMVMGTHFVLTGEYSLVSLFASLVPFFLVNNLLLLNQFPDIEADKQIGRNHLSIARNKKTSVFIYGIFFILAYLIVLIGFLADILPWQSLLAIASIVFAIPILRGVIKYYDSIPELIPYMGKNVAIVLITPILLSIGLFLG
jgi:1,4-dihydroxy-2-naphthoate polyprenyltransferase